MQVYDEKAFEVLSGAFAFYQRLLQPASRRKVLGGVKMAKSTAGDISKGFLVFTKPKYGTVKFTTYTAFKFVRTRKVNTDMVIIMNGYRGQ